MVVQRRAHTHILKARYHQVNWLHVLEKSHEAGTGTGIRTTVLLTSKPPSCPDHKSSIYKHSLRPGFRLCCDLMWGFLYGPDLTTPLCQHTSSKTVAIFVKWAIISQLLHSTPSQNIHPEAFGYMGPTHTKKKLSVYCLSLRILIDYSSGSLLFHKTHSYWNRRVQREMIHS